MLAAKGLLHAAASRIILSAAVIDDVLGLIVLAIVSSVAQRREPGSVDSYGTHSSPSAVGPEAGGALRGEEVNVHIHAGIHGIGNMNAAIRAWRNPVAKITIRRARRSDD